MDDGFFLKQKISASEKDADQFHVKISSMFNQLTPGGAAPQPNYNLQFHNFVKLGIL